jgi:hypothetical protein
MSVTIKPRTTTVPLYQGDDLDRLQQLADAVNTWQDRLDEAQKNAETAPPRGMLDTEDPVATAASALQAAREAHDAFLAEAEPRAIKVTLEALGRKKFRSLADDHPPREGNEGDQAIGVNDETFKEALVPLSIVSPKWDTSGEREEFLDSLALAQFRKLYLAAYLLNAADGADPKALTDSVPSLIESATQH